jgi:hypothetical protein
MNGNSYKQSIDASDDDYEFHVRVHPNELEGIDGIWRIATESNDHKVNDKALQFLIKLYTSMSYTLEKRIPEFEDCFIEHCFQGITHQK